jgi:hypothetical protein
MGGDLIVEKNGAPFAHMTIAERLDTLLALTSGEATCRFVLHRADGSTLVSAPNYIEPGYCIRVEVRNDTLLTSVN